VSLHQSLGFEVCAKYRKIGIKHGRWVDRIHMQKDLDSELELELPLEKEW